MPMAAHPVTGFLPLLGQAALRAVNGPVAGGEEIAAAQDALLILAGYTQNLLLQLRCQGQDCIPEPDTLQTVAVPLGTAWVNTIIQRTAIPIMEIAAVVADQASHLPKLMVMEPGQLTHCQTPACSLPCHPYPP